MQAATLGIAAAAWATVVQAVEGAPAGFIAAAAAGLGLATALLALVTKVSSAVKESLEAGARREERALKAIEELARLTREMSVRDEYRERLQEREFDWLRERHEEGRREFAGDVATRVVQEVDPILRRGTGTD